MSREVIERYFTAINVEDWDTFRELLTDDVVYQTTGARAREGRDVVADFFGTLFKAWKEHYDDPMVYIVDGENAAVEVDFRGVSLNGVPIDFKAIDVFHFRDGKISSWATWYDLGAVRKKLEGMPA